MIRIVTQVIEATTKEVLDRFKKEYIQKYVYDAHEPTVYYNPDSEGRFYDAWEWTAIERSATKISSEMFMNPSSMNHEMTVEGFTNTENYSIGIHGSRGFGNTDARESMDIILNETDSSKASPLWLTVVRPIGYWDIFISDFVNGGKLKQVVDKYSVMYGLTVR